MHMQILRHNNFLERVKSAVSIPGDQAFPDQVNEDMCIVGRLDT